MTEENIELTVEELNSIAGGRALTDAEQQDILWAAKKIKSISATDSYVKKILSHYADEYQKIYDKYMNLVQMRFFSAIILRVMVHRHFIGFYTKHRTKQVLFLALSIQMCERRVFYVR